MNRGASHQGNKCFTYGKYVVLGGLIVLILNVFFSEQQPGTSSRGIFEIEQQRKQMLRDNQELQSRRTPPNFAVERLQRREHEEQRHHQPLEAPEEFPDTESDRKQADENHLEKAAGFEHVHHEEMDHEKTDDNTGGDDGPQQDEEKEAKDEQPNDTKKKEAEEENNEGEEEEHNRVSGDGNDPDEGEEEGEESDTKNIAAPKEKIQYVAPNGDVLEKPEGTGPTKLGYVMDLVYERRHPGFRNDPTAGIEKTRQKHAQKVSETLSEASVTPCEYLSDNKQVLYQKNCRDPESHLLVYNSAPFPRTWCGTLVPPQSAARMETHCNEPVHLFDMNFPPVSGQGMPPIVIHSHADGNVAEDSLEDIKCSIPCKMEKDMSGIGRYVQGTDWKIFHSDKDPNSMKELQVELSKYKHDEYFSTTYFRSDVPLSFIDLEEHNLRNHPPVDFDSTLDKGSYIVSENCGGTGSRRTRWFEVLAEKYHVDALGVCNHNKDLDAGESIETMEDRLKLMKKYKFNLGFEASTAKDRFTDLSYEAMLSGAVPILLGPPNGNKHFPKHSAIFANDFNHWDKLADYVNKVATNKTLWESFHKWRTDEAELAAFEKKYQFTKISPECRMCTWAYAKMYGLGWDHSLQQVQETHVPRKTCFDEESGLVSQPFQEIWSVGSSSLSPSSSSSCKTMTSLPDQTLQKGDWKIVKSVVQHDSVTDITIQEVDTSNEGDEIVLTFEFKDVNNTEGGFFRNSHTLVPTERGMFSSSATIQDHKSKVTVVASWVTTVSSPEQGKIQVIIQNKDIPSLHKDEVRRIRIITEDMGQLHDKMTEYFPSSFSKRIVQDFVDPLEVFYAGSEA